MERKVVSGIMLTLLLTILTSTISINPVEASGASQPIGGQIVYRGGTFTYYFVISTRLETEDLTVSYWFDPPLDPLIVSFDPPPPVTLPPGTHNIRFDLTVPADAPLRRYRTKLIVSQPVGVGIAWELNVSVLSASIDFDPPYIYVGDGDWIYCHIEPPQPTEVWVGSAPRDGWFGAIWKTISYGPTDIDVSTVRLNDTVPAEPSFMEVSDFDQDGVLDLRIAFNRSDVMNFILGQRITDNIVTLNVTGQFSDGWAFAGSNQVEIVTPERAIQDLINTVQSMNLQQGIDNSLDAKLANTLASLEAFNAGQRNDTINKLSAFINEVEAQRGNKITNEQADYLIAETQRIIALIQE